MENEQKNNPQQNQENQEGQNQSQGSQKQGQQGSQYAGTTQGGQGAPASDGVESSDGRNTTIDGNEEHSIAGREDS